MNALEEDPSVSEDARELATWTRRYAQYRALHVVIVLVAMFALFGALFGLWLLAGDSYRSGNYVLLGLCIAGLIPANLFLAWVSIPWWGGRWLERVSRSCYRSEGTVAVVAKPSKRKMRTGLVVALLFGSCVVGSVALGFAGYLPQVYIMPVSALYVVPFLVVLHFLIRPEVGHIALLWPLLYGIHAALYLIFPSVRFHGALDVLNILLPCAGYGALAAGLSHLYSRYALSKVKRLAQTGLAGDGSNE